MLNTVCTITLLFGVVVGHHLLQLQTFDQPCYCSVCKKLLHGCYFQGYSCSGLLRQPLCLLTLTHVPPLQSVTRLHIETVCVSWRSVLQQLVLLPSVSVDRGSSLKLKFVHDLHLVDGICSGTWS